MSPFGGAITTVPVPMITSPVKSAFSSSKKKDQMVARMSGSLECDERRGAGAYNVAIHKDAVVRERCFRVRVHFCAGRAR